VTHLRQIMLEELRRRNYAESTIHAYIHTVEHFSRHFHRSPDQLGPEHIRQYQAALFTRWKLAAKDFFVLGLFLGPILEESVFRGCMLPVLTRTLGNAISVVAIAVLFAAFHGPGDVTHWVWFTATGAAYGSLRLASGTTTAAAFMHATCNLTLFLSAKL
jgi:membrane protease YdiL (CAAX protease family)